MYSNRDLFYNDQQGKRGENPPRGRHCEEKQFSKPDNLPEGDNAPLRKVPRNPAGLPNLHSYSAAVQVSLSFALRKFEIKKGET